MLKRKIAINENWPEMLSPTSEAWSIPRASALRESAIESSLFAIAVGEAFGLLFEGTNARQAETLLQQKFSSDVMFLRRFPSRHGIMTHLALSSGQSLLQCRSNPNQFAAAMKLRLVGHQVAGFLPSCARVVSRCVRLGKQSGFAVGRAGSVDRLLPSMLFMSAVLQGTTNRITTWATALLDAAGVPHQHDEQDLVGFLKLAARAAQFANFDRAAENLNPSCAMDWLLAGTHETVVLQWLQVMQQSLDKGADLAQLQANLESVTGLSGLSKDPRFTVCSAIYVWLLHPADWQAGLLQAASLGGSAAARCSIYSVLAMLSTDGTCLPLEVVRRHHWWPVSTVWLDAFIGRLLQWPHGEDDLVNAHGVRSPALGLVLSQHLIGVKSLARKILLSSSALFTRK